MQSSRHAPRDEADSPISVPYGGETKRDVRVFLYEFITGGGLLSGGDELLQSLEAEGRSMLAAVAEDFIAMDGIQVTSTRDARLTDFNLPDCRTIDVSSVEEERDAIGRLAADADATLLIAPELDGALYYRAEWVESAGGQLISPGSDFVGVATDKRAVNHWLKVDGIRVPESRLLFVSGNGDAALPDDFIYPAVVKRVEGAGSVGTRLCSEADTLSLTPDRPWMIESFCAGIPASVAVLCGPAGHFALPPFRQRFEEGSFRFTGGARLTNNRHVARAHALADRVVRALEPITGYIGIDFVLGHDEDGDQDGDEDGAEDFVIEINPRLTTSYIGLRAIARGNLAEAMLDAVAGRPPSLSFGNEPIEFAVERKNNFVDKGSSLRNLLLRKRLRLVRQYWA